jgi:hypothetical protein
MGLNLALGAWIGAMFVFLSKFALTFFNESSPEPDAVYVVAQYCFWFAGYLFVTPGSTITF